MFLLIQAVPAIKDDKANFLLSRHWNISGSTLDFGVLQLLWTTVVVSLIAMIIAVPISIGIALFITFYAPKRDGPAGRLHHRPARRDPVDRLRHLGHRACWPRT